MKKRNLGSTGISVSEVGFGGWQLGNKQEFAGMNGTDALALVHAALDLGCNFFDTAPNYGLGASETLLGQALKGKREKAVISTKFGHHPDDNVDFSANKIRPSLEGSLQRLQTDYVDVLLLHNPPFEFMNGNSPLYEELEKLKKEGKIRAYGCSVDWSREILEVLSTSKAQVLEVMLNVFHQEPMLALSKIKEKNPGIIVKVPLDSGWLAGKYNSDSKFTGVRARWTPEIVRRRAALVEKIRFMTEDGSTMTQASLRFLLAYPEVSSVIPGVRTIEQLKGNLSASDKTMAPEIVRKLKDLWTEELKENPLPW